jgi:hypothetical protein
MQSLSSHLTNAANMARQGNVQQLVQMTLQQNPELAQKYNILMQRFPNMSPTQVWNTLAQRYGIDFSKLGL